MLLVYLRRFASLYNVQYPLGDEIRTSNRLMFTVDVGQALTLDSVEDSSNNFLEGLCETLAHRLAKSYPFLFLFCLHCVVG